MKTKNCFLVVAVGSLFWAGCQPVVKSTPTGSTLPQKPLALALGGGGTRGFAHIGVIEALEAKGIRPQIITGSSAGSVAGSLYASGLAVSQLRQQAENLREDQVLDFAPSHQGLIVGERLRQYINQQTRQQPIERFPIRFAAVATDRETGEATLLQRGEAGQAVRASAAVPMLFVAPLIGTRRYVDGAISQPVPVTAARQLGATCVIAVDVTADPSGQQGIWQQFGQALATVDQNRLQTQLQQADVVIRPQLAGVSSIGMANRQAAISAGQQAVQQAWPKIQTMLAQKGCAMR